MITELNRVKQYLNLSLTCNNDYDVQLSQLCSVADNMLTNYLGTEIVRNTHYEYNFNLPYPSSHKTVPFVKLNSLHCLGMEILGEVFELDNARLIDNRIIYNFLPNVDYKAILDVGYDTNEMPEMIKQAGVEMTAIMFKESDILEGRIEGRLGVKSQSSSGVQGGNLNTTYENIWDKWKNDLKRYKIIATGVK
jgi:hypothetical protein